MKMNNDILGYTNIDNRRRTIDIPDETAKKKFEDLFGYKISGNKLIITEDEYQKHGVKITGILVNSYFNSKQFNFD